MYTIVNLFGRSPFAPLGSHMEEVAICVHLLPSLFAALEVGDYDTVAAIGQQISEHEHIADIVKEDIRKHLPRSLFLPIDRSYLLDILSLQDSIANKAEDVAVLVNLKPIVLIEHFKADFHVFLDKNIETFNLSKKIIDEMHELLESSFGGNEAERVKKMVSQVEKKEHETDLVQRTLLKNSFAAEDQMTYSTFHLWQKIFEEIAAISNLSEKLAHKVKLTLESK